MRKQIAYIITLLLMIFVWFFSLSNKTNESVYFQDFDKLSELPHNIPGMFFFHYMPVDKFRVF